MFPCIFYFLLFPFLFLITDAFEPKCPTLQCTHTGPDIHYPFRVLGRQPEHCGRAGFELFCKKKTTAVHFPNYGDLVVKSISYNLKKIDLLDPKNCVHEVFLNLNLSSTRFQYYYLVRNYTYLNCSTRLPPPLAEIPCLSGSRHHVYTVEHGSAMGSSSCRAVKTVAVPFAYSPYVGDDSLGLGLTWSLPGFEEESEHFGFISKSGLQSTLCSLNSAQGFSIKNILWGEKCSNYFLKVMFFMLISSMSILLVVKARKLHLDHPYHQKLLELRPDSI